MIRKLWNSACGMMAQALKIDTIANNVANVNTPGFKKSKILFEDLLYRTMAAPGNPVQDPVQAQHLLTGQGARAAQQRVSFLPGSFLETGRELDFAIDGEGFFRVILPDGREAFTREGNFYRNGEGALVTAEGYPVDILSPELAGLDYARILVDTDGTVEQLNAESVAVGTSRLPLYRFRNPEGLEALGNNLWAATAASGEPERGNPGEDGFGRILQGFMEQSNVNLVEEMTNLVLAQRAYEINSRSVRTADEMWQIANQIRR